MNRKLSAAFNEIIEQGTKLRASSVPYQLIKNGLSIEHVRIIHGLEKVLLG